LSDLPKEQQSAYQRWEMTSFDAPRPVPPAPVEHTAPAPEPEPPPPDYPTPEELAAIHEQARLTGYEAGRAAGHADALEQGKLASSEELDHLKQIAQTFTTALAEADHAIAGDVLDLALHLARCMLKTALQVRPELVLPLVREAIELLPVVQQPAVLMLNPEDAQMVREGLKEELEHGSWRIVEDPQIGRGGCKVDTASNQIDAQAAARWQRLTHALGKDLEWIGP
jgi:flagellar assembly protein FliH